MYVPAQRFQHLVLEKENSDEPRFAWMQPGDRGAEGLSRRS